MSSLRVACLLMILRFVDGLDIQLSPVYVNVDSDATLTFNTSGAMTIFKEENAEQWILYKFPENNTDVNKESKQYTSKTVYNIDTSKTNSTSVHFEETDKDAGGKYVCQHREVRYIIQLYVVDKPKVKAMSSDHKIVEGHDVHLMCYANSTSVTNPTGKGMIYKWTVNDISLIDGQQYGTYESHIDQLNIHSIYRDDSRDRFQCKAKEGNDGLVGESNILELNVEYGPTKMKFLWKASNDSVKSIEATEGDRIDDLVCDVQCNPKCAITWTRPNKSVVQGSILVLGKVDKKQTGTYRCIANNSHYNSFKDLRITINRRTEPTNVAVTCAESTAIMAWAIHKTLVDKYHISVGLKKNGQPRYVSQPYAVRRDESHAHVFRHLDHDTEYDFLLTMTYLDNGHSTSFVKSCKTKNGVSVADGASSQSKEAVNTFKVILCVFLAIAICKGQICF